MISTAAAFDVLEVASPAHAVAEEARRGLASAHKSLSPWLFYDEPGSQLFEQITELPEYYLTRTERELFRTYAADIFHTLGCPTSRSKTASQNGTVPIPPRSLTLIELGAGTASKTGILLRALTELQSHVLYQPIDISPTALEEARTQLEQAVPAVTVRPRIGNYVTDGFTIERPPHTRVLALYIGSSIGNFTPAEARGILTRLRSHLQPGDALLLGTDLAPALPTTRPQKPVATLLAAYNDSAGITAAFNRNILARLNRDLGANFDPEAFAHRAVWNPSQSRMEIYLDALTSHTVTVPANSAGAAMTLRFARGESIHTENSYKFTPASIAKLLSAAGFTPTRTFTDPQNLFAVTLASAC